MASQPKDTQPAANATHVSMAAKEIPATAARNTGHPLLKGEQQLMDYFRRMRENKEHQEMRVEELKEWKATLNRLAATKDGAHMLRVMVLLSGLFQPGNIKDTVRMVEDSGKADFYLRWIRPHLDPSLRKEIE